MVDEHLDKLLAIAPHFTVHRETEDRFLLFSEDRSYRLRGGLYPQLVPLLDGSLTGRQVLERLPGEETSRLLQRMLQQRYIVPLAPRAEASRQAFWSAQNLDPDRIEDKLACFRVAVVATGSDGPSGSAGAAALLAALVGSGLATTGAQDADLLVLLVDDYLDPALMRFARDGGRRQRWLPMKPAGHQAWIGPLLGADAGCPDCLTRRLAEHRPNDGLAKANGRGLRPARGWTQASLDLARATAVLELTRLALGEATALTDSLVSIDARSGARTPHRHWRFADCPACGKAFDPAAAVEHVPVRLRPSPSLDSDVGGWRTLTAEQALLRLEPLVSPITGIISHLHPVPLIEGLHVFAAAQASRATVDHRENRRAGQPGSASGKGLSAVQAKVSCLAEAVERYSCGWTGTEPRRVAKLQDLGETAIHPQPLLNFSERQYRDREALNKASNSLHFIPKPFDPERAIEWSPAWSLRDDAPRWLPTRYCFFDYRNPGVAGDHLFCQGDSNGCAAGNTLEEAILQGLLELVERDAVALWWYNRLRKPAVAFDGLDGALVERTLAHYRTLGRTLHLLDLTADTGVPAVVAVTSFAERGNGILLGLGAHVDPRIAAERAICELNQSLNLGSEAPDSNRPKDSFVEELRRWLAEGTLATDPYLAPAPGAMRRVADMPRPDAGSIDGAIAAIGGRLAALGLDLIVLDYARVDTPLVSVKVVVPGMRHFWSRRGPGRLFDVPVRMGWLPRAYSEDELNPVNFVL